MAAGIVLGFDFGSKRIGIATGQTISSTASSLCVLPNQKNSLWPAIEKILSEWKPEILIVGLPLDLDGKETLVSQAARKFSARLHGRFGLPVEFQDERFSSMEAAQQFASLRAQGATRQKNSSSLDAAAARIITQAWLEQQSQ
ncbi:MAG: Holliday junction resolvase RuvX [Xanthomonadales bacterium]|nr:Holliday junction resolvase RuvX [Xanthomonadales bacterium]